MLIIPADVHDHFKDVYEFARNNRIVDEFHNKLLYLHLYGGSWLEPNNWVVTLGYDFAPYSFSLVFKENKPDASNKIYGGLIFHGDVNDEGIVTSERAYWGVHT